MRCIWSLLNTNEQWHALCYKLLNKLGKQFFPKNCMRSSGRTNCTSRCLKARLVQKSEKPLRSTALLHFGQTGKVIFWFSVLFLTSVNSSLSKEIPTVRISEFMASNVTTFPDNVDFDDYSDWIELENTSDSAVNLRGFYLTDNLKSPLKWAFPINTIIPAKGFLTVRADDFNATPGEDAIRAFSPWSNFTVTHHHTNFKLSEEGESIGLYMLEGAVNASKLIPNDAQWKFNDQGLDLGDAWRLPAFEDSSWESGPAPLGYGDNGLETTLNFGSSSRQKHPTYYLRHAFHVDEFDGTQQITIRFIVDDGAIIYLNGSEIHRTRMPQGLPYFDTLASQTASEGVFESITLNGESLVEGENVIAVEVHQASRNSSDIHWELEMWAEQTLGDPILVDAITYKQQYPDVSYGRTSDASEHWIFYGEPTPNQSNSTPPTVNLVSAGNVAFSLASGFFDSRIDLSITTQEPSALIHYTTDGSIPTSRSPVFTNPLSIVSTTVIRARAITLDKFPGQVETGTFFIGAPNHELPIASLAVEPDVFFDSEIGIYRNVHKGREAPINLEFLEQGISVFNVNAGAKISGENIWRFAQKPLNITLRGKYGNDVIEHQIFKNERVATFGEFVFRNGGDNWSNAMLRDAITPFLLKGQSPNDVQNYRPCVLYLNGAYWGIHNIRGKLDDVYFATHHHINTGTYDYLEYAHVYNGNVGLVVKEGDSDAYLELEAYAESNDLSNDQIFQYLADQVNLISVCDYIATEDFVYNSSWRHNREFWRERKKGAKWHWILPDLDRGFQSSNLRSSLIDNFQDDYPLLEGIMDNEGFRNLLAQRYAAHLSSTFFPDRIDDILESLDAPLLGEMNRHIDRWDNAGGIDSLRDRQDELDEIRQFASERAPEVLRGIQDHLDMGDTVTVDLNTSPINGGRILVAGVPALLNFNKHFELFKDIPVTISVEAAPGFIFEEWDDLNDASEVQEMIFRNSQTLTARFIPSNETPIPTNIDQDLILTEKDSPFIIRENTLVKEGVSVTVEAGVELRMSPLADLRVQGNLKIQGTETNPITIHSRDSNYPWAGSLIFNHAEGVQRLSHLILRDGGMGQLPQLYKGAISNIDSELEMDHLDLDSPTTIFAKGGRTSLLASRIHTPFTGDGINVKQGWGRVENSTFFGNDAADTDAIDFDGVSNGIIRGNRIYGFRGPNSDGIDIGENCAALLIEENRIYNNSDKGISVGQGSSVIIRRNLIVGCQLAVGIKDQGSFAHIEQNTFHHNEVGVALFEKNLRRGGGNAIINSTIFSDSGESPVTVDEFSDITITFSLSDNFPLAGENNLLTTADYQDPANYNFALKPSSSAINHGDPSIGLDEDGSLPDIGAYYIFNPLDFPFIPPNLVVINEIMAHSHNEDPDWIELHNTSSTPIDISGWFLSDSQSNLKKYEIDEGSVIDGHGYLTFYENTHFGVDATSNGRRIPFALSENGETVYLHSPSDSLFLDYTESESFGPSATGVSKGRYAKPSTGSFNFVAMDQPTPNAANSLPLVGPIVISEIMYHPKEEQEAEYIELHNISNAPVTFWDEKDSTPWQFTNGIKLIFPSNPPMTMQPNERILVVRNLSAFKQAYSAPNNTITLEWTDGALSNQGETIELSRPGDVNDSGIRQFIREERIVFDDGTYWPNEADGLGSALIRIDEFAYGNDPSNWRAGAPSPGIESRRQPGFNTWKEQWNLPLSGADTFHDPDGDGRSNLMEYALQSNPTVSDPHPEPRWLINDDVISIDFEVSANLPDIEVWIETTETLGPAIWIAKQDVSVMEEDGRRLISVELPTNLDALFVRLAVRQIP